MNNAITITVGDLLLRPGLSISTKTSERYAATAAYRLVNIAREVNALCEPAKVADILGASKKKSD